MRKKGLLALGLALMLCPINVFAASNVMTDSGSNSTSQFKYTADTTHFVITIPAVVDVNTEDVDFTVESTYMNLRPDEEVVVFVKEFSQKPNAEASEFALLRQNIAENKDMDYLTTTVYNSNKLIVPGTQETALVGRFLDSNSAKTNLAGATTVKALTVTDDTQSGDYLGTMTFELQKNDK